MAINVDEYLEAIAPDQASGPDLQYDPAFIELEQAVKGKPEQQMGDTIVEAEPPNWREIKTKAEAFLLRSTDLRVLISYLRALIAIHGFSGLADGLNLLKTLTEQRWDTIHPQLDPEDDNDPTERINVLMALCDHDTMLKPLQQTPLIESKAVGRFNFREINIASGRTTATSNEKEVNQAAIDAAIQDSEPEVLQQTADTITICQDCLNQLEAQVTDYVGVSNAPSFADLRGFLKESKQFLTTALAKKGGADFGGETLDETASADEAVTTGVAKSITGAINNDQDVIKVLNLVCNYYKKHEPSSPVPMFVERAIRLVGKNFMDVIKDIAPTGIDEARMILGKQQDENE